jgi:hypothetical protein
MAGTRGTARVHDGKGTRLTVLSSHRRRHEGARLDEEFERRIWASARGAPDRRPARASSGQNIAGLWHERVRRLQVKRRWVFSITEFGRA